MENELPGRFIFIGFLLAISALVGFNMEMVLGLDLKGGAELVYTMEHGEVGKKIDSDIRSAAVEVILKRIDPDGAKGYTVVPSDERIIIKLGGVDNTEKKLISNLLEKQGTLEFRMALGRQPGQYRHNDFLVAAAARDAKEDSPITDARWYGNFLVEDESRIKGDALRSSSVSTHPDQPGSFVVNLSFKSNKPLTDLSTLAAKWKSDNGGRGSGMAIIKDDIWSGSDSSRVLVTQGECDSAPSVSRPLTGGSCYIEGNFTFSDAKQLSLILNSGSLPVKLKLESSIEVGPTLGAASQEMGKMSCIYGLLLVLVFMIFYYRGIGIIAAVALVLNLIFVYAGMASFGFVLTLPGIAGVILTIGMAVDANVLIYERIKEELREGYSITRAVHAGYEKAFVTIFDSNLTTFITGLILYIFGTGAVRGFAITLCLGIIASMFSAIYISRTLVEWLLGKGMLQNIKYKALFSGNIKFIGSIHRMAVGFSIVAVLGFFMITSNRGKENLGIEFMGGSRVQLSFRKNHDKDEIEARAKDILRNYSETVLKPKGEKFSYIDGLTVRPVGRAGNVKAFGFLFETKDDAFAEIRKAFAADDGFAADLVPEAFPTVNKENPTKDYSIYRFNFVDGHVVDVAKETAILKEALDDENLILTEISDEDFSWAIFMDPKKLKDEYVREQIKKVLAGKYKASNIIWSSNNPREVELSFYRQFSIEDFVTEMEGLASNLKGLKARAKEQPAEGKEALKSADKVIVTLPESFDLSDKSKAGLKKLLVDNGQVDKEIVKPLSVNRVFTTELSLFVDKVADVRKLLAEDDFYIFNVEERSDNEKRLIIAKGSVVGAANTVNSLSDLQAELNELINDDHSPYKELAGNESRGLTNPVESSMKISGAVAKEMSRDALISMVLALIAIVVYITYRFEFRFGVAAIVALVHDVTITLGVLSYFEIEYNLTIVGAMLTIVGYSLNDTIVVFDRIRENLRSMENASLVSVINKSLNQSLSRTILTSVTTLLAVVVLFNFGGPDLRPFSVALITGLIVGTYSSMFVASPVLLLFGKSVRENLKPLEVEQLENE